ncbi:MAG: cytochrome c biogenesis protein ResB [Opitutales bacterium]|nr:cytochrome c biogenesis protein ResB [Opitutales bacterium]
MTPADEAPAPQAKDGKKWRMGKARPSAHRGPLWDVIHFFGNLKLAMFLFLVIIVASLIGITVESSYDDPFIGLRIARAYVYEAPWFNVWIILLCINLFCAAFTRWPWKKQHTGFVVTHAGIIILLTGGMIGRQFGYEGSIRLLEDGEPTTQLTKADFGIQIWDLQGGGAWTLDFPIDLRMPRESRKMYVPVQGTFYRGEGAEPAGTGTRILDQLFQREPSEPTLVFDRYSASLEQIRELRPEPGSGNPGIAFRLDSFMLSGMGADMREDQFMITEPAEHSFLDLAGQASIVLVEEIHDDSTVRTGIGNILQIAPAGEGAVRYQVSTRRGETRTGRLEVGESLETGWEDFVFTLNAAYPEAYFRDELVNYEDDGEWHPDINEETLMTGVRGYLALPDGRRSEPEWFLPGSHHRITIDNVETRFIYGRRIKELPFTVELDKFTVTWDEGTTNPASYESILTFRDPATGETLTASCSMNRPASFPPEFWRQFVGNTYKFSQAGWNPDDLTESRVQVLYDPGWLLKWIGSLVMVAGVVIIFYIRPYRNRRPEDRVAEKLREKRRSQNAVLASPKAEGGSPENPEKSAESAVPKKAKSEEKEKKISESVLNR